MTRSQKTSPRANSIRLLTGGISKYTVAGKSRLNIAETVERRRSSSSRLLPQRHSSQARDGLSTSRATSRGHASRQSDTVSRYQTKSRPRPPHTPPRSRTESPRAMQEQKRSKKSRSRTPVPPLSPISEVDGGRRGGESRKHRGHSERSSRGDSACKESSYRGHQRKAASMPRERERDSSKSASQRQSGKFRRSR
ncbi:hypothetical protein BO85DRAFT_208081 [Aspergillus piperis CBS 112811]|uniref:Uncharacterized protein n=1 Tax=Aspergillus piperis CBS 112811 TaxID=1448313 RepID=A0A8G1QQC2_9EURO|nr:hypothetical protein BO85DRAFT_208081 [Aspergillus piperis CBS 112811]RAH52316.1 hypothetical protein BO85DRAFT_208081 [Aspergillus piperis CBS 112811]